MNTTQAQSLSYEAAQQIIAFAQAAGRAFAINERATPTDNHVWLNPVGAKDAVIAIDPHGRVGAIRVRMEPNGSFRRWHRPSALMLSRIIHPGQVHTLQKTVVEFLPILASSEQTKADKALADAAAAAQRARDQANAAEKAKGWRDQARTELLAAGVTVLRDRNMGPDDATVIGRLNESSAGYVMLTHGSEFPPLYVEARVPASRLADVVAFLKSLS
ncbi:hypothetical protein [Oleiharenicola sp. Vm1]|uniref:hypothetical protein n=1 Tax=Oleiharenicola sp. Vm1 TaxID=3398393 RepID=UPI0039F636BC